MINSAPAFELYTYSALGAALLWTKATALKKKALGFGDLIEKLLPESRPAQYVAQFIVFVGVGSVVGVAVTGPSTILQAMAGGVAWCRIITSE